MSSLAAITAAALALLVAAPASAGVSRSGPKNRIGVIDIAGGDCAWARVAAAFETHWGKSKSQAETASGNTSYQNHHRWYSPDLGRYLSGEPLLQNPGFARGAAARGMPTLAYSYASNAPTTFTDPTGQCPWCIPFIVAMALTWQSDQNANIAAPLVAWSPLLAAGMGNASGVVQLASGEYDKALGSFGLALGAGFLGANECPARGGPTLYRAVGADEFVDLQALGRYRVPPGGMEGKYFFQTPEQASNFARMMGDQPYTTTSVRVTPAELARGQSISPAGEGPGYFFSTTSVPSGPVTIWSFEGSDVDFGFELELERATSSEGIAPGASGTGRISFWAVNELPPLNAGQVFELREGTRVVGRGTVLEPNLP